MTDYATLTLELSGLRNTKGVLCVALFADAEGYPDNPSQAICYDSFPITTIPQKVAFSDIPFGYYAAAVFHDENADSKMNVNFLGIPKEGIGFSGDPQIWKGVPSFEKVEFEFTPHQTVFTITLKYFGI
jgi:uncharacterized protein (DUF2141 family)